MSPQLDQRSRKRHRERRIAALATRQHGALSLNQLAGFGLSGRAVRDRVKEGRLHRVHRGAYALGRPDLPPEGHWMAAVLACGEGAVLSHRAAAALYGLFGWSRGTIDVTIPRRSALSRRGIRIHRCMRLTDADRVEVERIPCTSVSWTLLDLATTAPPHLLKRACNQAERLGILDMRAVKELVARRAGQPGVRRLSEVLHAGGAGEGIPRNELERRFLALCERAGLPRPSVNEWMAIAGEEMQCDFVWHAQRVVVEVDGWDTHRTRQAFEEDRRRDRVLRLSGWTPVRFTWGDVTNAPAEVEHTLWALLLAA
jgi:hypothetical protein